LKVAKEAVADLDKCEMKIGRTTTTDLSYVRRYFREDGTFYGTNYVSDSKSPVVRHETEVDNEMQLLMFDRVNGKDILMMNWQCHACTYPVGREKGTVVSADWIGPLRTAVEETMDVHFVYHQGCAGNIGNISRIAGVKYIADYKERGIALAQFAKEAFLSATEVKTGTFKAKRMSFIATHNERYKEKEKVGDTAVLYLNVLSVGDVAFATAPCEWHDTCGQMVKENSPFQMTFICAYTNGTFSYIPSSLAFDNGGYETNMCHFVKGTGEAIADRLLQGLSDLT
jgi:hypothetical protein